MDLSAIALEGVLWWLLLPVIGLPLSLVMYLRGHVGFLARLWVWFAVVPVFLGSAWLGLGFFSAFLSCCGVLALREVVRLETTIRWPHPAVILAFLTAGGLPLLSGTVGVMPWPAEALVWLSAPTSYFLLPRQGGGVGRILAAALFLAAGLSAWLYLLAMPYGYRFVLVGFSVITVADILAFVSGRLVPSQHPFPRLSPGKTVAGYLGGGAAGIATGLLVWFAVPELNFVQLLLTALLLVVSGAAGDLVASGIKRLHGVKDFSNSLGRMGGVFDRLDSLLGGGWPLLFLLHAFR